MKIEINERDIIYILNCINITLIYLKYHTKDEKDEISNYYNFDNYNNDYYLLNLLHRRISTKANMEYYNVENYNLFIGQRDYLNTKEKDFEILKNNKNIKTTNNLIFFDERKHNKFYFKYFFKKSIDKLKRIV